MSKSIKEMAVGENGRVVGFLKGSKDGKGNNGNVKTYRKKLLSMGLTPGTELSITRYAPMGDPVEIQVRGYSLTLRREEAEAVLVEPL